MIQHVKHQKQKIKKHAQNIVPTCVPHAKKKETTQVLLVASLGTLQAATADHSHAWSTC